MPGPITEAKLEKGFAQPIGERSRRAIEPRIIQRCEVEEHQ